MLATKSNFITTLSKSTGWICCRIVVAVLCFAPAALQGQSSAFNQDDVSARMNAYANAGQFDKAREVNTAYKTEYERSGEVIYLAKFLMNEGILAYWVGDCDRATSLLEEAVVALSATNFEKVKAQAYHNLVLTYSCMYDHAKAFEYAQKELNTYKQLKHVRGVAMASNLIAQLYEKLENHDSTYVLAHRSRLLAVENRFDDLLADADMTLGSVLLLNEQYDSSLYYLRELLTICDTLPLNRLKACALEYQGYAYNKIGRYHAAADALEQAIQLFAEQQWAENQCYTQLYLAEAYIYMHHFGNAQRWIDSTEVIMQQLPDSLYALLRSYTQIQRKLADAQGDSLMGVRYYKAEIRYADSIRSLRNDNLTQVVNQGYSIRKKEEELLTQQKLAVWYDRLLPALFVVFAGFIGGGVFLYIYRTRKFQVSSKEREAISIELDELHNSALTSVSFSISESADQPQFDRERVQHVINASLNETDWKLLQELSLNPNASNKYLAEQISISHEGVRSSLKKMYRLFHIEGAVVNKKLALVLKVTAASVQE